MKRKQFIRIALGSITSTAIAADKPKKNPPNLLFLMTDQQRFDAMRCAGNMELETPNLDRLAAEGVMFENAYSTCPVCVPARSVLFTGLTTENCRVMKNVDAETGKEKKTPTFDSILVQQGYHAEYYGKWHAPASYAKCYSNDAINDNKKDAWVAYLDKVSPARPLKKGELIDKMSQRPYVPLRLDWRFGCPIKHPYAQGKMVNIKNSAVKLPKMLQDAPKKEIFSQQGSNGCLQIPPKHTHSAYFGGKVIDALERCKKSGKSFTITCSFNPPHPPNLAPEPYFSKYPASKLTAPGSIHDSRKNSPYKNQMKTKWAIKRYSNKERVKEMKQVYYAMVNEVDAWVGKILNKLDELGFTENTMVIFISDHGENMGDHGLLGKFNFYEGSAHVPFLIRFPGRIKKGVKVDTPVAQHDVAPTILDYLGAPALSKTDGRSLRNLIEGKNDPSDFAISEWRTGPTVMMRTKKYKLMYTHMSTKKQGPVDALYDMEKDPLEMNNLIGNNPNKKKYQEITDEMVSKIKEYYKKIGSPRYAQMR